MTDAEKVREALRPGAENSSMFEHTQVEARTALDSILTELAEAKRTAEVLHESEDRISLLYYAAEERAEQAEARARTWMAEDLPAQVSDLSEMLTTAEARIQELEAALRKIQEVNIRPEGSSQVYSIVRRALAEDEA